jgi:dTDP-glucose pyrophosphorylase
MNNLTAPPDITVKAALKLIDLNGLRILLIVNDNGSFAGTLSDGDIRRHLLTDGSLMATVDGLYNRNPTLLPTGYSHDDARNLMLKTRMDVIPIIDTAGKLVDYVSWSMVFEEHERPEKTIDVPVVVMAGGKGTRLEPFTKILPKPLIPVGEKPIVEHIMDRFSKYGINDFHLIVNYKGEMIKSYFDNTDLPYAVHYIWEPEFMGTAGSLRLLPENFPETLILSNCDVLIEADVASIVEHHKAKGHLLTIVASIQHYRIPYGVISIDGNGLLCSMQEKPEYDLMVNTGLYVVDRAAVALIPEGREYHMTDLATALMKAGKGVSVYPVGEKAYVDIGQWEEYRKNISRFITD